jgi:hypothetical protein
MSPWDVEVIRSDGIEAWLISDLERVFYDKNSFLVRCGDGSIGELTFLSVGRIFDERREIVDELAYEEFVRFQAYIDWLET